MEKLMAEILREITGAVLVVTAALIIMFASMKLFSYIFDWAIPIPPIVVDYLPAEDDMGGDPDLLPERVADKPRRPAGAGGH